jgi:raffinose/stachyose/melibiose transport system substrate-binding protein
MSNQPIHDWQHRVIGRRALLAGVAASPFVLAACSSGGSDSTSGADVPPGEVGGTLRYWISGLDSIDAKTVNKYKSIYIEPFEKLYPNVTVDAEPQNDIGLAQKLQTALAAGQGPDVLPVNSALAILYSQAGFLADLGPLAKKENFDTTFLPWALDIGVIDGKLLALPVSYETLVLYYNKALFETNGWTPPTDRASLDALAAEMDTAGVIPFTNANADYPGATEHPVNCYLNMVAGAGKLHDALVGDIAWTDPAFVASMQMMIDDFNRGWFSGGVKQYLSTSDPGKYANLVNGTTGMFLSGTWEIGGMNDYFGAQSDDWDWVGLPALGDGLPSGYYPLALGDVIAINAATDNMAAAEAFVTYRLTDADARWNAIKELGDEPLPTAFDAAAAPKGIDPRFIRQYQAISDASEAKKVGYVTWTSFGSTAEGYLLDNQDKLLTGDVSADDFCSGLDDAFQKDQDKGLVPPAFPTAASS